MFVPPTYPAATIFNRDDLDRIQECVCGHEVKLRDCLACFTHAIGSEVYTWHAVCPGDCFTKRMTVGVA